MMPNRVKWRELPTRIFMVWIIMRIPIQSPDIQTIISSNYHHTRYYLLPGTYVFHFFSQLRLHLYLRELTLSSNMQSILDICASAVSPSCTPPCETPMMNTLAGLPVELLLSITDFLPPTEWSYLYFTLQSPALHHIQPSNQSRSAIKKKETARFTPTGTRST